MTRKEDSVVLSYHDCLIRVSDIKILRSNKWLNDAIIGFYLTFLEKERFHLNDEVLLIGPEVTQCLKESPSSDVPLFLDPLDAKKKKYIFMAVNDSGKSAGGTHWSLLLCSQPDNRFLHYDSSAHSNYQSALKLAFNLGKYFNLGEEPDMEEMSSLQQDNSYDCGIYLICNLENIVGHLTTIDDDIKSVPYVKKELVATRRKYILELIEDSVKKQKEA